MAAVRHRRPGHRCAAERCVFSFQICFPGENRSLTLCGFCFCVFSGQEDDGCRVLVLSYPQYCRYRSVLARLREQPSALLIDHTVLALGGIAALGGNTRILYCRDTFDHPALLQNESVCDEFGEFNGSVWERSFDVRRRRRRETGAAEDGFESEGSSGVATFPPDVRSLSFSHILSTPRLSSNKGIT